MKSQKILLLVTDLLPNGGVQRFNKNLIEALKDNALDYKIISLNDPNTDTIFGANKNKFLFIFFALKTLLFYQPEIILLGHLHFTPLAKIKKLFSKIKIISIIHGHEAWRIRKKFLLDYPLIDEFWAVSQYTKTQFSASNQVPLAKIKLIFNSLPFHWKQETEQPKYQNYFLTVSRLVKTGRYKGIDKTLKAIALIRSKMRASQFKYIILGWGDDLEYYKKITKELQIESLVEFKSNIPDEALKELYRNCSFFILPSTGEGFGIVYLEAMFYQKACIGAMGCGADDPIESGKTGFLIEAEPKQISQKIALLIQEKKLCKEMGEAGFYKLQSDFSFPKFKKLIVELLRPF